MDKKQQFQQIHIDVARNATDDFNPFHDKNRWQNIADNPFGGPIVLGFQLEGLIEAHARRHRRDNGEYATILDRGLVWSQYEFRFAGAVKAGEAITVDIKTSRHKNGESPSLSNRVSLRADGKLVMTGYKRETRHLANAPTLDLSSLEDLGRAADRSVLADGIHFLKRKYMTTSNAKNFLCGSLVEQSDYIDEIADKVGFPEMFPCSLISCALLERASLQGHDFEQNPMVYGSHNIFVNREHLAKLRSNDALHLLCRSEGPTTERVAHECFGIIGKDTLLFSAKIELVPLARHNENQAGVLPGMTGPKLKE